ncbi:HigA family addiction module antitoxin [Yersinia sp. 2553 StPb PI]|uniref:HigA family addiction module antitoxin n=1 Tax=Yersinia sp. 2553 StPb PI TaxID=3117411 RepID=UPI003FA431E2
MLDTTTREPTTVGEILQEEFLTPLAIGQEELADIMGVTRATVNRLCKGRRRLTVEEATLFSGFCRIKASSGKMLFFYDVACPCLSFEKPSVVCITPLMLSLSVFAGISLMP